MEGGRELGLERATVRDVLCTLETEHPAITGWILDGQKTIGEHVNVFVNGERSREETALGAETQWPRLSRQQEALICRGF